jgi:hypothetical protein
VELPASSQSLLTRVYDRLRVAVSDPGRLLWRLEPTSGVRPGVTGASTDHEIPSLSIMTVTVLGIRLTG